MDKLGPRSDKCNFIGYPKETKGYYFYLADEQKVFVSLKAIFLEKEFLGEGTVASKVELEDVRQVKKPTQVAEPEPDLVRLNPKPIVLAPLRRSSRVPRQPDGSYGFLVREGDLVELDENDEDPITYMDAM